MKIYFADVVCSAKKIDKEKYIKKCGRILVSFYNEKNLFSILLKICEKKK